MPIKLKSVGHDTNLNKINGLPSNQRNSFNWDSVSSCCRLDRRRRVLCLAGMKPCRLPLRQPKSGSPDRYFAAGETNVDTGGRRLLADGRGSGTNRSLNGP